MISEIKNIEIKGIAAAVPKLKYYNIKYPFFGDGGFKKFYKFTGIKKKRIASKDIYTSTLVKSAAEKLIKKLNWDKKKIDIIILITQTPDFQTPATAIKLQDELKLNKKIIAFDINLGCSAFPYGISVMSGLLNSLNLKRGLLLIGDTLSKVCNYNDRSTFPIFGDAGSAIALENTKCKKKMYFNFFSDGKSFEDIIIPSYGLSGRSTSKNKNNFNLRLKGANVYSFAVNDVPKLMTDLIIKSKLNDKIKYCVPHQANKMIVEQIEKKIGLKNLVFLKSYEEFGNTSNTTIPLTMVVNKNFLKSNNYILASGFGVGSSISNLIFSLKKNTKLLNLIEI